MWQIMKHSLLYDNCLQTLTVTLKTKEMVVTREGSDQSIDKLEHSIHNISLEMSMENV